MNRNFLFLVLLVLFIFINSCGDNTVNTDKDDDTSKINILFSPDSLVLDNDTSSGLISFFGFNFKKYKPEFIEIDSIRFGYEIVNDSIINVSIKNLSVGYHSISFKFSFGRFSLEKKLKISYNPDSPPSSNSLYFYPDTLFVDFKNDYTMFDLLGTNFYKYRIDSVLIGTEKCLIGKKDIYKLQLGTRLTNSGTYSVFVYYKGQKIKLTNKLIIVNTIIDFDFYKFTNISVSVQKFPILYKYSSNPEGKIEFNQGFSLNQFGTITNRNICRFSYDNAISHYVLTFVIDSEYRILQKLIVYNYNRSSYDPPYREETGNSVFINLPFNIKHFEKDKIELSVEISGNDINNYFPLTEYSYSKWGGSQKNNDWVYGSTISKLDPSSQQKINFYPATDSSSVKIYLRNF